SWVNAWGRSSTRQCMVRAILTRASPTLRRLAEVAAKPRKARASAGGLTARGDPSIRVVGRMRTGSPEAEVHRASALREQLELLLCEWVVSGAYPPPRMVLAGRGLLGGCRRKLDGKS